MRIAAKDAPWDGILARAFESGGFAYRPDHHHIVRIARSDRLASVRPLSGRESAEAPVSLTVHRAELADLERLFEELSGLGIDFPPGPHEPVTMAVGDVPWDRVIELIAASRGWKHRIEGKRLRVVPAR